MILPISSGVRGPGLWRMHQTKAFYCCWSQYSKLLKKARSIRASLLELVQGTLLKIDGDHIRRKLSTALIQPSVTSGPTIIYNVPTLHCRLIIDRSLPLYVRNGGIVKKMGFCWKKIKIEHPYDSCLKLFVGLALLKKHT